MRQIPLTQNSIATVDDADYEYLIQWKWYMSGKGYAVRDASVTEGRATILMHRVILDAPAGAQVDHINQDKLDNRRSNLRLATDQENKRNRPTQKNSTSGYKGVCWHAQKNKWRAQIYTDRHQIHIGCFEDKHEAAHAYDTAAKQLFGEYAYLNFPDEKANSS